MLDILTVVGIEMKIDIDLALRGIEKLPDRLKANIIELLACEIEGAGENFLSISLKKKKSNNKQEIKSSIRKGRF